MDGPVVQPVYAQATVEIEPFEGEIPAPGWQPPDWDLNLDCEICEI